jgi:hypothetical protein
MSRRKPSKADYKALQRNSPVGVRYPPGRGRAEIRVPSAKALISWDRLAVVELVED